MYVWRDTETHWPATPCDHGPGGIITVGAVQSLVLGRPEPRPKTETEGKRTREHREDGWNIHLSARHRRLHRQWRQWVLCRWRFGVAAPGLWERNCDPRGAMRLVLLALRLLCLAWLWPVTLLNNRYPTGSRRRNKEVPMEGQSKFNYGGWGKWLLYLTQERTLFFCDYT